jgi:hypothetical protein
MEGLCTIQVNASCRVNQVLVLQCIAVESRYRVFDGQLAWHNLSDALHESLSHTLKTATYAVWGHLIVWSEEDTPNNGIAA